MLERLLGTAVGALGLQLADWEKSNHGRMLRVFIEKTGGAAARRITLEDCEAASRQIQHVLEVEGVEYDRLEVSSPGLDRKLKTAADFARFAGHKANVEFRALVSGRRRVVGTVERVEGDSVEIQSEDGRFRFDLANLRRARLVPEL
jgi:ribosome maturation factor RimP